MKKLICMVLAVLLLTGSASATILEPQGVDLGFKLATGIEAKYAVVLCRSLSVHLDHDATSRKMKTLSAGDSFLTWDNWNEWYNCYYSEERDAGWTRNYYLLEDPAYYITDGQTAVYAYGDTQAPRVALLGRNEELPIILETDEWCVVSIRGASGWIRKTSKDAVRTHRFQPDDLQTLIRAELNWTEGASVIEDPHVLAQLSGLLSDAYSMGPATAGCPFGTYLILTVEDGRQVIMEVAGDNCCIYRLYGRDYRYGSTRHINSQQLFSLFPEQPFK